MYIDSEIITLFLCFDLVLLGVAITFEIAFKSLESSPEEDDERNPFLDSDGNHTYYERSLIEKTEFRRRYPQIPLSHLRSFKRLLHWL